MLNISGAELLNVEGVAERVGCSVQTIRYRMARAGLRPTHTVLGANGRALQHLFDPDDVDKYFAENPLVEDNRRGYA